MTRLSNKEERTRRGKCVGNIFVTAFAAPKNFVQNWKQEQKSNFARSLEQFTQTDRMVRIMSKSRNKNVTVVITVTFCSHQNILSAPL